jgi:transposase
MQLTDFARQLPQEVRELFEPLLPPVVWQWAPPSQQLVGKMRNAVERCHNFFAQFGRVFRRFDRSARSYLAWIEMAACVIRLRSGFVS